MTFLRIVIPLYLSIFLLEHDLRANASRLSRGKTGAHFSGSCSSLGLEGGLRLRPENGKRSKSQNQLPGINPAPSVDIRSRFRSGRIADAPDRLRSSAGAGAHKPADIARRSVHPTALSTETGGSIPCRR